MMFCRSLKPSQNKFCRPCHKVRPILTLALSLKERVLRNRHMLSDQEKQEITAELAHCEFKQSASIDALKIIQKHRGWVSDEAIRDVAAVLEMSADELDAVATFYSFIFRRPVGRHVILVCDSISCWVMGYNPLLDLLKTKLGIAFGETTGDNRFTLLPISCLGACDRAPAMMVDDQLHGPVTVEMITEILDKYE
jgi:NADH-quinone oxidoreductase subunit E